MNRKYIKNFFGVSAGTLTVFAFVPQMIKVILTKETEALALLTFIIIALEVMLWSCYGFMEKNKVIFITNILVLMMTVIIIYYKLVYG